MPTPNLQPILKLFEHLCHLKDERTLMHPMKEKQFMQQGQFRKETEGTVAW
jgi:hypothetical protein